MADEIASAVQSMYDSNMQDLQALSTLYTLVKHQSTTSEQFRVALSGLGPLETEVDKFCTDPTRAQVMLQLIDLDRHYVQRFVNRCKIIVLALSAQ
jgi:hypothetical protein